MFAITFTIMDTVLKIFLAHLCVLSHLFILSSPLCLTNFSRFLI